MTQAENAVQPFMDSGDDPAVWFPEFTSQHHPHRWFDAQSEDRTTGQRLEWNFTAFRWPDGSSVILAHGDEGFPPVGEVGMAHAVGTYDAEETAQLQELVTDRSINVELIERFRYSYPYELHA